VEPDGQWRYAIGAGSSRATGNTEALSANVNADAVRATAVRKIVAYGRAIYGRNDGTINASRFNAGNNWSWELGDMSYAFGSGDWLRDRFANLSYRTTVSTGIGLHLLKSRPHDWDVFGGLAYSHDRYITAMQIAGLLRTQYGRFELLLGNESHHRPTETTTLHQKLVVYPAIDGTGNYRIELEAGVAVAISQRLALTATLSARRNKDPGGGVKRNDTLFVTGVSFRIE
jgi:putative salt-induced outer membrane protein YdiY